MLAPKEKDTKLYYIKEYNVHKDIKTCVCVTARSCQALLCTALSPQ